MDSHKGAKMVRLKPSLTDVLTADKWWFTQFGESLISTLPTRHLIFQDNQADILAVGHIDTVTDFASKTSEDRTQAMNLARYKQCGPQLDDRLGVWALLSVLPDYMNFDLLLTDDEEHGRSTAAEFETKKEYNWLFELDRRGEDVVLYQYGSKKWNKALDTAGFKRAHGSFSDIGYLDHLGVQAVNVGIGYHNEHTMKCDWDMDETRRQLNRLLEFYKTNHKRKYGYTRVRASPIGYSAGSGRNNHTYHKPITRYQFDDFPYTSYYEDYSADAGSRGHTAVGDDTLHHMGITYHKRDGVWINAKTQYPSWWEKE